MKALKVDKLSIIPIYSGHIPPLHSPPLNTVQRPHFPTNHN